MPSPAKIALLKTSALVLLEPGVVAVLIPFLLIRSRIGTFEWVISLPHIAGSLFALIGACIGLWSAGLFALVGKGTPAPIDPPKELVAVGAYRFVRNPMYIGVALLLLGEAVFFVSLVLMMYVLILAAAFHLFVVFYEEPALRKKFGQSYENYCLDVSRWLPRIPRRRSIP